MPIEDGDTLTVLPFETHTHTYTQKKTHGTSWEQLLHALTPGSWKLFKVAAQHGSTVFLMGNWNQRNQHHHMHIEEMLGNLLPLHLELLSGLLPLML